MFIEGGGGKGETVYYGKREERAFKAEAIAMLPAERIIFNAL